MAGTRNREVVQILTCLFPSPGSKPPQGLAAGGFVPVAPVLQWKAGLTTSVVPGTVQHRFCPRGLSDFYPFI